MRRTRKWAFVAQEAKRLADLGLPPVEIAKRLGKGVNRSTVQRWMASGKIRDTRKGAKGERLPAFSKGVAADAWAMTVRKDFALDATDEQLVALGEMMLVVSKDPLQPMSTRIAAAARFQGIAKQLNLIARATDAETEQAPAAAATARTRPERRLSVDPRNALMSLVK